MIKVLCFLFDPNIGGPTIRARAVSEVLKRKGIDFVFALPNTQGTAKTYLENAAFRVIDLSIPKPVFPRRFWKFLLFVFSIPFSLFKIFQVIRHENPDVVHINGAFDILPAIAARFAGVAVVWHLNDMVFREKPSKILGRIVASIADVVAVSAKRVATHYSVDQSSLILLRVPVDITMFTPSNGRIERPLNIGMIGNWNPIKQQGDFLDVLEHLLADDIAVNGVLHGKLLDSQREYWKPLIARTKLKPLRGHIKVAGFTTDVSKALDSIDIVLITSKSEAGPMSCVEALASGTPVVAYNVGDVENMLRARKSSGSAGLIVEVGDIDAMVAACKKLSSDRKLYKELSDNAIIRARHEYSLQAIAGATETAYRMAIDKQQGLKGKSK